MIRLESDKNKNKSRGPLVNKNLPSWKIIWVCALSIFLFFVFLSHVQVCVCGKQDNKISPASRFGLFPLCPALGIRRKAFTSKSPQIAKRYFSFDIHRGEIKSQFWCWRNVFLTLAVRHLMDVSSWGNVLRISPHFDSGGNVLIAYIFVIILINKSSSSGQRS